MASKPGLLALLAVVCAAWMAAAQPPQGPTRLRFLPLAPVGLVCNGTTVICIAQSAAGSNDGSSCANARALSYLTTSGNWGGGGAEIDPDDAVVLCGTITGGVAPAGSGTSGHRVIIDGTGATLGASADITTVARSYLTFQNITYVDGQTAGVDFAGGTDITLDNLFARDGEMSVSFDYDSSTGLGTANAVLKNSYIRTETTNLGDTQHDIINCANCGPWTIEGNYLEHRIGGAGGNAHNDVIQSFHSGCSTCGGQFDGADAAQKNPQGLTLRYNRIKISCTDASDRSWTVLENLKGTNYVYGNIFEAINGCGSSANGFEYAFTVVNTTMNVFNNTFVPKSGAQNVLNMTACESGNTINIKNNIFRINGQNPSTGVCTLTRAYNVWFGTGAPGCGATEICSDPLFTDYTNNDFTLQSGSPAKDAGFNVGSPYDTGLLVGATWPNPATVARTAPWEIGAYQF